MTVLVCGSRDWTDTVLIRRTLMNLRANNGADITKIVHGGCRGADTIAARIAKSLGFHVQEYPADWEYYGRAAGPIRNQQMLDEEKPYLVIAFATRLSGGTFDMVQRAQKADIRVQLVEAEKP